MNIKYFGNQKPRWKKICIVSNKKSTNLMGMVDSNFKILVDCLNYNATNKDWLFFQIDYCTVEIYYWESICISSIINICGKETVVFLYYKKIGIFLILTCLATLYLPIYEWFFFSFLNLLFQHTILKIITSKTCK